MVKNLSKQLPHEVLTHIEELGRRIRTARVRRRIGTEDFAQACGITRRTLYRIERGEGAGVHLSTFLLLLWKLGLLDSLYGVANPDTDDHGKILEAAARPQRVGAPIADNDF